MKNYIWERFWRLIVLEEWERLYTPSRPSWFRKLNCICDCGNVWTYILQSLIWNNTTSCWCYQKEKVTKTWALVWKKEVWIHPMYNCWIHILQRCDNINHYNYSNYWLRWIVYDPKRKKFEWFYEDMKEWREKWLTLDRIDNDWNYYKSNCRWTTMKVQSRNKRTNIIYKWKCMAEWGDLWWIPYSTARQRIKKLLIADNYFISPKLVHPLDY